MSLSMDPRCQPLNQIIQDSVPFCTFQINLLQLETLVSNANFTEHYSGEEFLPCTLLTNYFKSLLDPYALQIISFLQCC